MPKSRHSKGKHPRQSKRSKARLRQNTVTAPPAVQAAEAARPPPGPASPKPVAAPARAAAPVKTTAAQYPFFTAELKRTGILAGIILIVLVVLSLVLS